ncbi:hypothetical protein IKF89_01785 [Candidatus Saccharibacteria bacterium]|nr:hypothetical protein [Candidatus Saccharibacteria bacterium]
MEESSISKTKKVKKKSKTNWYLTIGISLLLTAVVLAICFFMQGETKTSGDWPELETSESLSCEVEGLAYPLFKYDNSDRKTTKVSMVLNNGKLRTISLVYQLYYSDSSKIERSEAENHAAMNLRMQDEGLGPDALGMNFARLADSMKMSLYADASALNGGTVKYFELDNVSKYDLGTLRTAYEQKGFGCVAKN